MKPARPQNSEGGIAANHLPNRGSVGSGREPDHNGYDRCDPSRAPKGVHSDESGRLFLGGLVATRARLRFTGKKVENPFTWIDLHA